MLRQRSRLIVGLGNPGDKYRLTRHNMGFMVVNSLAGSHQIALKNKRFNVRFGRGKLAGLPVILAEPMTFMNRVGPSVRDLALSFALHPQDILVIQDDIDIVFGKLKIKEKGGDGGHNGVKSLIAALGTDLFLRVRVGIGSPEALQDVSAYVLAQFGAEQKALLGDIVSNARGAVETVLFKGVSEAMNRFHGKIISESNVGRRL